MMDKGLQALLDLNGESFWVNENYWVKFSVKTVEANPRKPHGIDYSLTLHNRFNERIMGFDNAHGVKSRKNYSARKMNWDHKHQDKKPKIVPYEFHSAAQLIEDFWKEVDRIIKGEL